MVKLPQLVQMYTDGLMSPLEQIELVQILLDTELLSEYPQQQSTYVPIQLTVVFSGILLKPIDIQK